MFEPSSLRESIRNNYGDDPDNLMQVIATCKAILDERGELDARSGRSVTAVVHVGSEFTFAQPWPEVLLVLPKGSPLPGERLTVRTSTYFPKGT